MVVVVSAAALLNCKLFKTKFGLLPMAEVITQKYHKVRDTPSDLNEHMETLYNYCKECTSVLELGSHADSSSWAIAAGLMDNGQTTKKITMVDIHDYTYTAEPFSAIAGPFMDIKTFWGDDLTMPITEDYDLTFIDTWHIYAQLKRELEYFGPHTRKYIIMHDTTIDGERGEVLRDGPNDAMLTELSKKTGFPENEIGNGLWPAIEEFLAAHPEWTLVSRYTNNNGLTILKRIS